MARKKDQDCIVIAKRLVRVLQVYHRVSYAERTRALSIAADLFESRMDGVVPAEQEGEDE